MELKNPFLQIFPYQLRSSATFAAFRVTLQKPDVKQLDNNDRAKGRVRFIHIYFFLLLVCPQKIRTPQAEEFNSNVVCFVLFSVSKVTFRLEVKLVKASPVFTKRNRERERGQDATPTFASDERSFFHVWSGKEPPPTAGVEKKDKPQYINS